MIALGDLPPVHAVVHSDTTHERVATYKFAARWTPWLEKRGVRVVTVSDRETAKKVLEPGKHVLIPAYTLSNKRGSRGQLWRVCTERWKIRPQRRWVTKELKRLGLKKVAGSVETQLGITSDEWDRMKDSDVQYVVNRYPFMEMDPPMSRQDVIGYLVGKGLEVPPKSACYFCPFHNLSAWREIKDSDEWDRAVYVDRFVRDKRPGYKTFLFDGRVPLEEIDFDTPQYEQGRLFEECSGACFL